MLSHCFSYLVERTMRKLEQKIALQEFLSSIATKKFMRKRRELHVGPWLRTLKTSCKKIKCSNFFSIGKVLLPFTAQT